VVLSVRPKTPGQPRVEIEVRDNGPGIPEEVLPKIWTPFFTTRQQGTGLGLAFVREIIADHGGDIEVRTGARGTTFTIRLEGQFDGEHSDRR
jgi:signal transduction histidine kinase